MVVVKSMVPPTIASCAFLRPTSVFGYFTFGVMSDIVQLVVKGCSVCEDDWWLQYSTMLGELNDCDRYGSLISREVASYE